MQQIAGTRGSAVEQRPAVAALCLGLVAAAMVMSLWLSFVAAVPGMAAFSLGRMAWKEGRPYALPSMVLGALGMLASVLGLSLLLAR